MSLDSELSYAHRDGRLLELIDETWQKDKLPNDELSFVQEQLVQNNGSKWCLQITAAHFSDIAVPEFELPAIDDSDHNGATDSLKEQEQKWTDLGIQQLQESPHHTGN
ncbi:Anaphase-promoting complex subunit 13 [Acropora cervicornis]|uniref:Anaphase-promoting complex subunit 13 n=1 Tax=Acropora cervicornis TaxID=6130 RepID=A0AAD9QFI1_ACRCE|nr:Anaphase-promoting complex subunit 13 [Acropora cervicornis]